MGKDRKPDVMAEASFGADQSFAFMSDPNATLTLALRKSANSIRMFYHPSSKKRLTISERFRGAIGISLEAGLNPVSAQKVQMTLIEQTVICYECFFA